MKANIILGKKQIILASLVLILGAAVYLNWQFADKSGDLDITDQVTNTASQSAEETGTAPENTALTEENAASVNETGAAASDETGAPVDETAAATDEIAASVNETAAGTEASDEANQNDPKILGDAQLVDSKSIVDETYFAMAKLSRTKSRDAAIETLSTILDGEQLTDADKQAANEKALAITDTIEAESRIENLVKAKGFDECIVYITDSNANVVVKASQGLTQDQATQIKNIVVSEGNIKGENISITEIN